MLSQAVADQIARMCFAVVGSLVETVTYHAKATAQATPVAYEVQAHFAEYSEQLVTLASTTGGEGLVRRGDHLCRIATAAVSWTPTHYDTLTRADGSLWRVLSIREGRGRPFYALQVRRVPGG